MTCGLDLRRKYLARYHKCCGVGSEVTVIMHGRVRVQVDSGLMGRWVDVVVLDPKLLRACMKGLGLRLAVDRRYRGWWTLNNIGKKERRKLRSHQTAIIGRMVGAEVSPHLNKKVSEYRTRKIHLR